MTGRASGGSEVTVLPKIQRVLWMDRSPLPQCRGRIDISEVIALQNRRNAGQRTGMDEFHGWISIHRALAGNDQAQKLGPAFAADLRNFPDDAIRHFPCFAVAEMLKQPTLMWRT